MKIIEATEEDIPTLIKLNNEAQKLHIDLAPEKYKKIKNDEITKWLTDLLNDQNVKILIAFIDSVPIGYTIARIMVREENAFKYSQKFIEIDHIVISKNYRSKGYGKRLIDEIKKYAKSLKIDTISLFVFSKNSSAVKAYEKMGFEPEGIKMTLNLKT
jgi:diamine N-acetyltransferase